MTDLRSAHLLFVTSLQVLLQVLQVATDLPQQQSQPVHDHVHLLLGLQTLSALDPALLRDLALRFGRHQQLSGKLLQGGDLLLRVQQLPLDLLQEEMKSFTWVSPGFKSGFQQRRRCIYRQRFVMSPQSLLVQVRRDGHHLVPPAVDVLQPQQEAVAHLVELLIRPK